MACHYVYSGPPGRADLLLCDWVIGRQVGGSADSARLLSGRAQRGVFIRCGHIG